VGYFFGGVPFVQQHFEVIVLGIVAVSVAPALVGAVKGALSGRKKGAVKGAEGVTGGAHAQVTPSETEEISAMSAAETDAQVTPSASRIPATVSATPLGFASGIAEGREFTPTDPLEHSAFDEGATEDAAEKFVDGEAN
jgi:membrane-associated protein